MKEDAYPTGQAARILKVTDRGVRKMIDCGELEAHQDEPGGQYAVVQAVWSSRRTLSTVAMGDEPLMNSHERRVRLV